MSLLSFALAQPLFSGFWLFYWHSLNQKMRQCLKTFEEFKDLGLKTLTPHWLSSASAAVCFEEGQMSFFGQCWGHLRYVCYGLLFEARIGTVRKTRLGWSGCSEWNGEQNAACLAAESWRESFGVWVDCLRSGLSHLLTKFANGSVSPRLQLHLVS